MITISTAELLQQNNPILYIIIGNVDKKICDGIRDIQNSKIGLSGIAYIFVNENYTDDELVSLFEKAHNSFMQKQYLYAGEIRINYILNANDAASMCILSLREKTERFLSYLYPVGILTDVFAIIDDNCLLGQPQITADVIALLETVSDDNSMVYIVSNVSRGVRNDENIINSIALISCIKDYAQLKPDSNMRSRYREDYFKKDALKNRNRFVSIGYANIKKPTDIIQIIVLTRLLRHSEKLDININIDIPQKRVVQTAIIIKALEKENLMGVAINTKQNLKNTTNIQAIDLLFNDRLKIYFELNFCTNANHDDELQQLNSSLNELASQPDSGFFAVYCSIAKELNNGQICSLLKQAENDLQKLNQKYMQWCNETIRTSISELQCFDLAKHYLEWQWEIKKAEEVLNYYRHVEKFVTQYYQKLEGMKSKIDNVCAKNLTYVYELEAAKPFINQSTRLYYESLIEKYLETHANEYALLYGKLYSYLEADSLHKYIELISDYIENTLLKAPVFNKSITDEALEILSFNQISGDNSYIFDWIINSKQYNIFLKTGDKHLYSEINILLDADSKLCANTLQSGEHINFFCNGNKDEIDILYHIGGFSKEELYYWELYNGFGRN